MEWKGSSGLIAVTLLIRTDEFCIGQYVTLHRSLDLRFRRASQQLMEVTMPADRRTRAAVPRLFEIIEPD
jgi:hypothetical protein